MSAALEDGTWFNVVDFSCRCGCGRAEISPLLIPRLDRIRTRLERPMIVTSGFRCQEYNRKIGGGPEHVRGLAADILCPDGFFVYYLVHVAMVEGVPRIGIDANEGAFRENRAFVHIGIAVDLPPALWTYQIWAR
jgi:hypothetical protein